MTVYLFDVDHTLECSNGPVKIQSMADLCNEGHITGICGNFTCFAKRVKYWYKICSLFNTFFMYERDGVRMDKTDFMLFVRSAVDADDYVLIGNSLRDKDKIPDISDDEGSAERAGWRFIKEDAFARGAR